VSMTGEVLVGETGAVLGQITAGRINVSGAVQGDLRGSEAVLLERGAKVVGDLSAPRIGIAHGALVRGSVRTEGEPAPAGAQPKRIAVPAPKAAPPALKSTPFVAKPVAKTEPKPPVVQALAAAAAAAPRAKEPERRPPPPVLPSLGKGAKGKKKKDRDE